MFNVMKVVHKNGNKFTLELSEPASISEKLGKLVASEWEEVREITFFLQTSEKTKCVATWIAYK